MNLYNVIGQSNMTNLLADPQGADVIAINCEPGNGELAAGQLMKRKATGLYAPAGTSDISANNYLVVLKTAVDTGDSVTGATVAEDAAAYRAGRFIDGKVILASNGTMTAAHKLILRQQGIVFNVSDGAEGIENGAVTITYVANNNATPAEDDVEVGVVAGETYTILNNSDSSLGFTAPATKSFSKWNTKADGTGTDYAAAASYTANADLKLYAVWA